MNKKGEKMLKKIFVNIIIIIMIFSLSIYATEVSAPDVSNNIQHNENNEDIPKNEITTNTDEEIQNTNTNINENNNNNTNANTTTSTNNSNNTNKESGKNNTNKNQNNSKNESTTTKKKSKDATLKKLEIDIEGMTPEFDKDVTEYYLVVNLNVKQINVTATPTDNKANVTVTGNKNLKEGKNTVTITVTAEDESRKKYNLYVTKVDDIEKANAELKSLEVENYELYPKFKANIYNYNLNIQEEVQTLAIIAEAENEKAKEQIEGNDNITEGENLIKINVTAEDGTTIITYKIKAYVASEKVEIEKENKMPAIILLVIVGSLIIGLGCYTIIKNKK